MRITLCLFMYSLSGLQELTDDEVGERKAWLRHNLAPSDTVQQYMRETQTARLSWIHGDEQPSLNKILEEYPRFKDPSGHHWVWNTVL